jgi:hypothetical protein
MMCYYGDGGIAKNYRDSILQFQILTVQIFIGEYRVCCMFSDISHDTAP